MNIKYFEKDNIFHLYNEQISYVIMVMKNKGLAHLYYGARLEDFDLVDLYYQRQHPTVCIYEKEESFTMATMRQEYSSYGTTDFSVGSFEIEQSNGSKITEFVFKDYEIIDGKEKIDSMPSSFGDCKTLILRLEDSLINCELLLKYSIFENHSIIVRSNSFINNGSSSLRLNNAMSMQLDLDTNDFKMLELDGAWARERHVTYKDISAGKNIVESTMGATGHMQNNLICLLKDDANEFNGQVYGATMIYSGSFLGSVEVTMSNRTRLMMGIHPHNFSWEIKPNSSFDTPEGILGYSKDGLNGLSQNFHKFVLENVVNQKMKHKKTPILINNWEATYFDFDGNDLINIAKNAAKANMELFVLDDGWFGDRNDATNALGDWFVNEEKLKMPFEQLIKSINDLGLDFGLWFEPEMISERSQLYSSHPEFVIKTPNRKMSFGREQYILDFSNKEVVEYVFKMMDDILSKYNISYVKWDMNRNITEGYSQSLNINNQGEFFHRYILGVYYLYELLQDKHPNLLIEACAGGGGRFDLGMLYYSPQIWVSDNTDPVERLKTQYGTSILYPLKTMSAHVSAKVNHQTGRFTNLDFKANVAYFGNFGYEVNLAEMTNEDLNVISKQIEFYNDNFLTFHEGKFTRLESPFEKNHNHVSWMVEDEDQVIVGIYDVLYQTNKPIRRVYLKGLNENINYIDQNGRKYSGKQLVYNGILLKGNICGLHDEYDLGSGTKDFSSEILVLKKIN